MLSAGLFIETRETLEYYLQEGQTTTVLISRTSNHQIRTWLEPTALKNSLPFKSAFKTHDSSTVHSVKLHCLYHEKVHYPLWDLETWSVQSTRC